MLRSTGFFRGIDCPFYKEYSNVKGDKEGCTRPYCHFRHKRRLPSYGAAIEVNKTKELIKQEQGYDPFNPEVVRPENQQNGESSSSVDMGVLELELVNRAIEEVRSEVEREKRKLSRIEDEEYAPTISSSSSSSKMGVKRVSPAAVASHLAYDPGSYQMTSTTDYNPTPRSSKYTLDSDNQEYTASSMEYVPTSVAKASVKKHLSHTHTPQLPSPPPKYSTNASSPKCKYTIDTSKPSTDMEYDPLSNFSARIAGKKKRTNVSELLVNKKNKLPGTGKSSMDEEYVPTVKKPRHQSIAAQKYTLGFSESDEESSGTEYRPTSLKRLQYKKSSSVSREEAMKVVEKESTEGLLRELKQKKEDSIIEEEENLQNQEVRLKFKPDNDKIPGKNSHDKSRKFEKVPKVDKEKEKSSISGMDNRAVSREECKKIFVSSKLGISHDSIKKDCKKQLKKEEGKRRVKEKSIEKSLDKGKLEASHVGRVKTIEKVKNDAHTRDKEREKRERNSKKMKTSDKEIQKHKEPRNKNCKIDGSRKETDIKKSNKNSSNTCHKSSSNNSSKSSCIGSKEKAKTSCSSSGKTSGKVKERSLSHVDLFGDESAEEHEKVGDGDDDDDEEEEEEILVRKSAAAFRRGGLNKRKASELTRSSSEDEDDVDSEDDRADVEEFDAGGVDYSSLQVDLDFDSDPMEECLRIFNESKDVKREDKGRQAKQPPRESEEDNDHESTLTTLFPGQKKRVSHFSANRNVDSAPKPVVQHQRRLTAQEICYQRMKIAQQQAAQLAAAVKTASASHVQSRSPTFPGERKRVAHRPSPMASSSKSAGPPHMKPAVSRGLSSPNALPGLLSVKAHTSAGILSKTTTTVAQKRMAHTPTMKSTTMKRPIIPTEFGAKVPTNVRQRYLNIFIDECVKFCRSEDIACQMGLEEEKVVYDRSSGKNIYLNVAVNTLKKLRSKSGICSTNTKTPAVAANRKIQSHEEVLGGRLAAKTSFTINRTGKQQEEKLIGATLYRKLKEYLMTEEQLQEHCYPRPHPEISGHAVVFNMPEKKTTDPFSKVCCRCGTQYKVNVHGSCVRKEECNHHWGRLRKHKVSGGWETNYSCCSGAVGAPGCQVAKQHVQDGRKESLNGYVQTFSKSLPSDGNGGVYALDCEMCYTKQGLELTRVTVINADLKVIYDTFVKPESKVVDYNTRFSGVTEEDLENATITLRDVQAVMLNMFNAESILIGHSLESDLFALKLIHSTVVDTAIVFPHRLGLPYKRALRNLMADHLKRIIQDNVEGHDSSEDASACMELMMWKIREDAKVKR